MRRMIYLLIAGIFVCGIFLNMAATARAAEQLPSPHAPAVIQPNPPNAPAAAPQVPMDPNAVAVFPTDSFDFGSVFEGNDVFHDFVVKNGGTADLKIINVKSG